MLQRFLFITLTLCTLTATAQWQQTGSKVRYVNGLGIPTKDTAAGVAADSSQIVIRPQDSALYIKYKRTWVKVGGGSVSGTTNYVAKFTSATALGNSQIFDNGTNVGVGTISPAAKLDVATGNGISAIFSNANGIGNFNSIELRGGTAGTAVNWQISKDNTEANAFQLIPSTTAGGTTYTTPALTITSAGNLGIGYTAPAAKLSVDGTTLINTNTDNGVDKLQVSGSMNVSAKATVQNLSVTNNATVGGTLNVTGIGTFSNRIQVIGGGGIRLGVAGASASLSTYLGGSTDAYPLVNNAYVISGIGWKYLDNGPASVISYESGDLLYYTIPTNSSGADATIGAFTQRYRVTAGGNFGIGTYAAPAAKLAVEGTALINTNTDNNIDKLQVNGSISGIGMKQAYVTKTGAYTATDADYVIDCTANTFTVTLPASSGRTGRILIIKNSGAGTITVDGNGAETIDGAATYAISVQYGTIQIMSDGTNWKIIAKF